MGQPDEQNQDSSEQSPGLPGWDKRNGVPTLRMTPDELQEDLEDARAFLGERRT